MTAKMQKPFRFCTNDDEKHNDGDDGVNNDDVDSKDADLNECGCTNTDGLDAGDCDDFS